VCSSGLKSTVFGVQSIQLGLANIVVVGGMESMTKSPYYIDRLVGLSSIRRMAWSI